MAPMPGVHVLASTLADETACAGGFMLAKKSLIICSLKKLNQISPAQSPIARTNTRVTTMRRFIGWLIRVPTSGSKPTVDVYGGAAIPQVSLDAKARGSLYIPSGRFSARVYKRCECSIVAAGARAPARRSSTRRRSLSASIGSGRLTLEAVAERAGLSKGGLLYNFPNKEALLQAMIQRMIDEVSAEKEALRGQVPAGPKSRSSTLHGGPSQDAGRQDEGRGERDARCLVGESALFWSRSGR